MAASDYPLLTALMAPCTAEAFLHEHWPSRPLQVHGPRERLPSLLLDPLLASAAELAQRYNGPLRFTHGGTERMVTVSDVNAVSLLDMGLTVQFLNLPSLLPGVPSFLRQLEGELGLHTNSIMFSVFAAPREGGLVCHFDNCDLISVQLAGSKRFYYTPEPGLCDVTGGQYVADTVPFDDMYAQACTGFPDPAGAHFDMAHMEPGSVLFVPRGSWHYTEASDNSLSVSITADAPAALRCLLDQLGMLLLQDARWRHPLIGGLGDSPRDVQTRAQLAQLLETLPEIVGRLAPEDLLSAPANAAWRLQHIGPSTRFTRTPFARIELGAQRANGMLPLTFQVGVTRKLTRAAAQVEMSAATVPLVRWIEAQSHGPFAASDLAAAFPDEPFATLKQVLQLCVQAQFLRLLWFPALAKAPHR